APLGLGAGREPDRAVHPVRGADLRAGLGPDQLARGRAGEGAGVGACHHPVVSPPRHPAGAVMPVTQQAPPGTGPVPPDARLAVAAAVRTAILHGEYAPGQRLIEADLCERYGTSRFIVRSALQELSTQGLVEFQRNRGARVREVSLGEAIEITEVRKLLEGLQAARAAERVTAAEAAALRGIVTGMPAARSGGRLPRYR